MASRFWVNTAGGTWDNSTTSNWATTSGGAPGASVPVAGDGATFDANSGSNTITTNYDPANANITLASGFTGTVTFGAAVTITGSLTLTQGTLNTNGQTVSALDFISSTSNARTLTLGATAMTLSSTATCWSCATITNFTVTTNTAVITSTGTGTTFAAGGKNYDGMSVVLQGGGSAVVSGGATYANFTRIGTATRTNTLNVSNNFTVSGVLTLTGNTILNRLMVQSNNELIQRTISVNGSVVSANADYIAIKGSGSASWDLSLASGGSGDGQGNSSITFTTPATQTWSGTSGGNWSANAWTTRVPLAQDDVIINAAFSASQTITMDMSCAGKDINYTGTTGNPTITNSTSVRTFGSVTLVSGMAFSTGTSTYSFRGRGSHTITSAGAIWRNSVAFVMSPGTYTFVDDFSTANGFTLTNGTITTNSNNIASDTFSSTGSDARTLNAGTSVWTINSTSATTVVNLTSTLVITGTPSFTIAVGSANTRTFTGGGLTFGALTYTLSGSTGTLVITDSNTFSAINFSDVTNARTLQFTAGTTTTISAATGWNVNGTSGKLMSVQSATAATHTISVASGTVSSDYLNLTNSIATGGAGFYAGTHSTDSGGNTGWVFTAPSTNQGSGGLMMLGVG